MDLPQTIAFLQWFTDELPLDPWHHEGSEKCAWIEANGFDPSAVLLGIHDLEQREILPKGFDDFFLGSANTQLHIKWISAANDFLSQQRQLMGFSGGSGSKIQQISNDYKKSLDNIKHHTDQEISKEINAWIESKIEDEVVNRLNEKYPKHVDQWGTGLNAVRQDYINKEVSSKQREALAAHGVTTNHWAYYGMYSLNIGFQINSKNGGYIQVEYNKRNGYSISVFQAGHKNFDLVWQEQIRADKTWSQFSRFIDIDGYQLSQATALLKKEEDIAKKTSEILSSPYVEVALKYDLGEKRYENFVLIYNALKYIQDIKFENLSIKNKIVFTFQMSALEYILVKNKLAKYQNIFRVGSALLKLIDSPSKIYQLTFEKYIYRSSDFRINDIQVDKSASGNDEFGQVDITITNKKTDNQFLVVNSISDHGDEVQLEPLYNYQSWSISFSPLDIRHFAKNQVIIDANIEKQAKFFQELQRYWIESKTLYKNLHAVLSNPILKRIFKHEALWYNDDHKVIDQRDATYIVNKWSSFVDWWGIENKKIPWLQLITPKSSLLLLKRLGKINFAKLSLKEKTILLYDLYYAQSKLKPYSARFYAVQSWPGLLEVSLYLTRLNKASTQLVSIAWDQITAGTFLINKSPLPKSIQFINRLVIDQIARQDPRLVEANKSAIIIEGNDITISVQKEPVFVSSSKVQQDKVFQVSFSDNKRAKSFLYPTNLTPHQFALNLERKWFASTQEQWAKQAYDQVQALDSWYQKFSSFPLLRQILRYDILHSEFMEIASNSKIFLILKRNEVISNLPSLSTINNILILLAQIDKNGVTKKQKRWLRKKSDSLQLSVILDVVVFRASTAVFVRRHHLFIKKLSASARAAEKITPDHIYQRALNKYFRLQLGNLQLEYGKAYKVPRSTDKFDVINGYKDNDGNPAIEVEIWNHDWMDSVIFSKQPEGWTAYNSLTGRSVDIYLLNKSNIYSEIISYWCHSSSGAEAIFEYKQINAFYEHTNWLLGLAFVPRYGKKFTQNLSKWNPEASFSIDHLSGISRDLNYFFSIGFKSLSKRKKLILIADYTFLTTYDLPKLGRNVSTRRDAEGKTPINIIYSRLHNIAVQSMKVTPADIYQREFNTFFGINIWLQKWNDNIAITQEVVPDGGDYLEIEIDTPDGIDGLHQTELIASKNEEGWDVRSLNYNESDYGLNLSFGKDGSFQFLYNPAPWQSNPHINIIGQWKGSISINGMKVNGLPGFGKLDNLENQLNSLAYLMGFMQNRLVSKNVHNYLKRHKKIDNVVKFLPSARRLDRTLAAAEKINFNNLSKDERVELILDYYRISYAVTKYLQKVSVQELGFMKQDIRFLLDLSNFLQAHKISPGFHGKIDHDFAKYGHGFFLNLAESNIRNFIYDIKHPKPHKRPWKQWKTWNERVDGLIQFNRTLWVMAQIQNRFFAIEKNAVGVAYQTYLNDISSGDSAVVSFKYAERSYISSLITQDKHLWNSYLKAEKKINAASWSSQYDFWYDHFKLKTPKGWSEKKTVSFADAKAEQLARFSIYDIYYREALAAKKLFRIQNDKYAVKLRFEYYFLKEIIATTIATNYISRYRNLYQKELKLEKHGNIYNFFVFLGLATWDLVKTPFVIVVVTWKDIASGDGFFKSMDFGLAAGFKSIRSSINYLAKDLKILIYLVDGLKLDIFFAIKKSFFAWWVSDFPKLAFIKTVDSDAFNAIFEFQMGAVFIAKAIADIPLNLTRDVNKICIGLVFLVEGKITFDQMVANDLHPIVKAITRLGKFVFHLIYDPKVIKHKINHVETLLHFKKTEWEAKYVFRIDRRDRHTRRRLHHQTFGLIKSPFEKFKQRHKGLYYSLKITNKQYIESGYFLSHPDAAKAEHQLTAIYTAQVMLNKLSNQSDLQKASQQLKNQFNSDWKKLSKQQRWNDYHSFKDDNNQEQSQLIQKFVVKDFEMYFGISGQQLEHIKSEDEKGIHELVHKEGKLHVASFIANQLQKWMQSVVTRQLKYLHAYMTLQKNHSQLASDILELDYISALYSDIRKEQKSINLAWNSWGRKDGKMLFNALTGFFLPGFNITRNSSQFFSLVLPFTVLDSNGKQMSLAQKKKIHTYDENHNIGHKVFDMIMWTLFLDKYNIHRLPSVLWLTFGWSGSFLTSSPLVNTIIHKLNFIEQYDSKHKHFKTYYHGFVQTYAVYKQNLNRINVILDRPVESLSQINSSLKEFMDNSLVEGYYKQLLQEVLEYDYAHKSYQSWIENMKKYHSQQLEYLEKDKYVLAHEVSQGKTVTVEDVLESFTPDGELATINAYDKDGGSNLPPSPSKTTKQKLNEIDHEIRVNPIAFIKNYEVVSRVAKALANKSMKSEAAKLKDALISDAEKEIKGADSIVDKEVNLEISEFPSELETTVVTKIDSTINILEGDLNTALDDTLTNAEIDFNILEDI